MERPFADVRGEGSPPLVLLHGFGGYHGIWIRVRGALPRTLRSIAYDLPGHRRSIALRDVLSPQRMAQAVLADLDARGVRDFHLAGHSMGGAVATLVAVSAPQRIASLTLFAPGGYGPDIDEKIITDFGRAQTGEELAAALRPMCAEGFRFPAHALGGLSDMRRVAGQREILEDLGARISAGGRQGMIPREMLAPLTMPVTVVWGEEDRLLSPSHADGLPAAFEVVRLPGAGHMLPEERPRELAGILLRQVG